MPIVIHINNHQYYSNQKFKIMKRNTTLKAVPTTKKTIYPEVPIDPFSIAALGMV